jgi:hypothetical protein
MGAARINQQISLQLATSTPLEFPFMISRRGEQKTPHKSTESSHRTITNTIVEFLAATNHQGGDNDQE